ncbi:uncharacterized protein LODBEIA_P37770 [Lodderomyces beijingensis]|uniref:C2H2-type domain-containing protein n=1 Tax=Lodderomyces beijingensis TaxID=1775926 RepID=A0ABP0ZN34_9ASCO
MSERQNHYIHSFGSHQNQSSRDEDTNYQQPDQRKPLSISQIVAPGPRVSSPVVLPSQDHISSNSEYFKHHQNLQQQQQQQQQPPQHFPAQTRSVYTQRSEPVTLGSPYNQHEQRQHHFAPLLPGRSRDQTMSYTMFSPNPASPLYPSTSNSSVKNNNDNSNNAPSPPVKKLRQDDLFFGNNNPISPSTQPNISYTRTASKREKTPENENEDQRFLRLARDALVATARGIDEKGRGMVDPTISDLLSRLEYASSPHGNPISDSKNIEANGNGQLNIQAFYQSFPNLSNNIFTSSPNPAESSSGKEIGSSRGAGLLNSRHHPAGNEQGWNFLIGEPLQLKADSERNPLDQQGVVPSPPPSLQPQPPLQSRQPKSLSASSMSSTILPIPRKKSSSRGDPARKFLCDKCSMSFRRSSDLKRHEKQHLTIPPNICEFCGKGFARKDALKRHVGTLTCKRNADKKLYIENLEHLKHRSSGLDHDDNDDDEGDDLNDLDEGDDDDDDDDERDEDDGDDLDDESGSGKLGKQRRKNGDGGDDDDDDLDDEAIQRKFPTYGYQKENWS